MADKPNILHINVDQQRFDTIRALGNNVIKTPNLDRLCESGVAFTNAYSPSPVCISARCSMIYGQYPMNTGCYANTTMPTDGRQSFMGALTDANYRTHGIGKCHFTPDTYALRGFQTRERLEDFPGEDLEKEPYFKLLSEKGYDYLAEPMGVRGEMYYIPQPSPLPQKLHPSQWVGDRSLNFIKKQNDKPQSQPWYLFSSFIHPHPPFSPPCPWHKLYRAVDMPLPKVPEDVESLQTYVNKCQNRYKYRDQGLDKNLLRCIKAYYYACISFVDFQIGRILDTLEENNQLNNTMILFTGDHGEYLGDYNCFGKRSMHDSAARIPFIISMPGRFEGGKICDTPVSLVDIAPTFLNVADTSIQSHKCDGEDVYDILTGASNREMVFSQLAYDQTNIINKFNPNYKTPAKFENNPEFFRAAMSTYMAVSEKWKYFYSAPDNQEFLFDKMTDPEETRNKAGVSFHNDSLKMMREKVFTHLKTGGETKGIDGNHWKEFTQKKLPQDPDTGLLIQDIYTPGVDMSIPGYTDDKKKTIKEYGY